MFARVFVVVGIAWPNHLLAAFLIRNVYNLWLVAIK